jgi:hypothetical protein
MEMQLCASCSLSCGAVPILVCRSARASQKPQSETCEFWRQLHQPAVPYASAPPGLLILLQPWRLAERNARGPSERAEQTVCVICCSRARGKARGVHVPNCRWEGATQSSAVQRLRNGLPLAGTIWRASRLADAQRPWARLSVSDKDKRKDSPECRAEPRQAPPVRRASQPCSDASPPGDSRPGC